MRFVRSTLVFSWFIFALTTAGESVSVATLNCYWFFQEPAGVANADRPHDVAEYSIKAGHLIGLLPGSAPLLVGFQEIGGGDDLNALAHSATARYHHAYEPLFVRGHDTSTGQNVGAILDTSRDWGVYGKASRVSDLEHELSKHLVVRLTNATSSVDVCVVHLRRPIGEGGAEKQISQCRALLRWAMRHLSKDPKANVIILGDFNEGHPPGSPEQAISPMFEARPPLVDSFNLLTGKISTHTDRHAYDRIIVSEAIFKGLNGLKLTSVDIVSHRHGRKDERRLYTDHFPVVATFQAGRSARLRP